MKAQTNSTNRIYKCIYILGIVIISFIANSCQNILEPTNIIPNGGFETTVQVTDQSNAPVPVTVDWQLLINNVPQGGFSRLPSIGGGLYSDRLPVPLSNIPSEKVKVVFLTTFTGSNLAEYAGSLPSNGNQKRDTVVICNKLFYSIELRRATKPICCGAIIPSQDLSLAIKAPLAFTDTAYSIEVKIDTITPCNSDLTINKPVILPADSKFKSWVIIRRNGVSSVVQFTNPTIVLTPGPETTVQWGISYDEPTSVNTSSSSVHSSKFIISSSTDANCITGSATIDRKTIYSANCACPFSKDTSITYPTSGKDEVCVDAAIPKDVKIQFPSITNASKDSCTYDILYSTIGSNIVVKGFDGGFATGNAVTLLPGQSIKEVSIAVQTSLAGPFTGKIILAPQVKTSDNISKPCSTVTIIYNGNGNTGSCAIDEKSTLFLNQDTTKIKTILVCPGFKDDLTTLIIKNTSPCPLSLNFNITGKDVNMFRLLFKKKDTLVRFNTGIRDSIVEGLFPISSITLDGNSEAELRIEFGLTTLQGGFCSGVQPLDFTASLNITGCTPTSIQLKGNKKPESDCINKYTPAFFKYGDKDATVTWNNRCDITVDGRELQFHDVNTTDEAGLFVQSFGFNNPSATPNQDRVVSAVISSGIPTSTLQFYKIESGRDIGNNVYQALKDYMCQPQYKAGINNQSNWVTSLSVITNDAVLFKYKAKNSNVEIYGLLWISSLQWSTTFPTARAQMLGQMIFPVIP